MSVPLREQIAATEGGRRLLEQEAAILEVTELICQIMIEDNVSRSELAARLGKSKGYVTQLLDGRANMTIRTIADVFSALGTTIHFHDGCGRAQAGVPQVHWNIMTPVTRDVSEDDVDILTRFASMAS